MERKYYPKVYLEERKYKTKKDKDARTIQVVLELDSGSDSEQFTTIL